MASNSFIVVIEWDGGKPPSRYYHRLHKLASRVRGDKSTSPVARRAATNDHSIILQEGAVLCSADTLARAVAQIASDCGAIYVQIGRVEMLQAEEMRVTPEDARALARVEAVHGKRGKPSPERLWSVMCYDCLVCHEVTARGVANCPRCGSFRAHIFQGPAPRFSEPPDDTFPTWYATRFSTGRFVVPLPAWSDPPVYAKMESAYCTHPDEVRAVTVMENNESSLDIHLPGVSRLEIYDAVFASRAYFPEDLRRRARVAAVVEVIQRGAAPQGIPLAEDEAKVDALDLSMHLGKDIAADAYIQTTLSAASGHTLQLSLPAKKQGAKP